MTFDIFGTVLDWRLGLEESCQTEGRPLFDGEFDRIVDAQGALEQGGYLDYATITRLSLVKILNLSATSAAEIASGIGDWPLYADATLLKQLMEIAPCAAMTNSDRAHGEEIQARLGFRLNHWLCAEDTAVYKPHRDFWRQMGRLTGVGPSPAWWHVSAYADYDLNVAQELGLTTVFVQRLHSRIGDTSHTIADLRTLLVLLS